MNKIQNIILATTIAMSGCYQNKDINLTAKAIKPITNKIHQVREAPMIPLEGKLGSMFGWRMHPIEKKKKLHKGWDLLAPIGTPIYASESGVVRTKFYEENGYGNYLVIEHLNPNQDKNTLKAIYAHLLKSQVRIGDTVKQGDLIGYVGNTGKSTGAHCHFELYINKGEKLDPKKFFTNLEKGDYIKPKFTNYKIKK